MVVKGSRPAEEGQNVFLVALVDGRVGTLSDINHREAHEKHIGVFDIIAQRGFRDLGIETPVMLALVERAKKMGLKFLIPSRLQILDARFTFAKRLGSFRPALFIRSH